MENKIHQIRKRQSTTRYMLLHSWSLDLH